MYKFTTMAPYELTRLADGSWKAKLEDCGNFVIGVSRSDAIAKADALNDRVDKWALDFMTKKSYQSIINAAELGSIDSAKLLVELLKLHLELRKMPPQYLLEWYKNKLQKIIDNEDANTALCLKLRRGQRSYDESKKRRRRDKDISIFIAFRLKKIPLEDSAQNDGLFSLAANNFDTTKEVARKAWKRYGKIEMETLRKLKLI